MDLPNASSIVQKISEPPNVNIRQESRILYERALKTSIMLLHIITRFLELVPIDPDTVEAKFELFAYKDKLLREILILQNEANPADFTKIIFEARVLGKFYLFFSQPISHKLWSFNSKLSFPTKEIIRP